MNPETEDGQADRHLYSEQSGSFWETFLREGVGKGPEETASGDKGEGRRENEKQKPHTTLKILTWRAREDSRGSNNSPAHERTKLRSQMLWEP